MRGRLLCVALAVVVAGTPVAHAETAPLPTGRGCHHAAVDDDRTLLSDTHQAYLYSDPVAATALPPAGAHVDPVAVTVTCTLHVFDDFGSGTPDPAIEASGSGTNVAVVEPVAVTYTATSDDTVGVCTRADVTDADGATYTYYQSDDNLMWYESLPPWGCDGWSCTAMGAVCVYEMALAVWLVDHALPVGAALAQEAAR